MRIRQLFDYETWSYTYLLWDENSKQAALIDPVIEQVERDMSLVKELGLDLKYLMETHIHADHITGGGEIRRRLGGEIVVHRNANIECANHLVDEGAVFTLGGQTIEIMHTPGHTNTDITYVTNQAIFTGDTLLVRDCGRTDFQSGSTEALYQSLTQKIFQLPDDLIVFPAHDYKGFSQSTIGEEKQFNHRVGADKPYEEFASIMDNLNLPKPRRIDIAVPGNLLCGENIDQNK
jgi:glyoxylase-like metal-dependent hydrolase (beta-lactamase superfamily II)